MMRPHFLLMTLLLVTAACAVKADHGEENPAMVKGMTSMEPPARSNRLRFRNGPVCMCTLGMTEEDIQRGQAQQVQRR